MLQNIKDFLNEKKEKITKIVVITLAVIIFLIIFSIQVQSYIKISKAKQEMLQEEKEKNEYTLKLINWVQEFNKKIPEFETKIRILKLKNRCFNDQIERKKNNKIIEINYCEKKENYEKFSELNKQKETNEVSFSFISKVNASEEKQVDKKVKHKYWPDDDRQDWLNYLYKKSWYDKDILYTFLWENWTFELLRKSNQIWSNWYYDFWLCQLNKQHHAQFINSAEFKNPYKQLDYCLWVRNDAKAKWRLATTFYAYNKRNKLKVNFEFYN